MFGWLKWFFWEKRRCEHKHTHWEFIQVGMGKVKVCDDCHSYLQII